MTEEHPDGVCVKIAYQCKMCGNKGTAQVAVLCSDEWVTKLYPLLACNPCADFTTRRDRFFEAFRKTSINLNVARRTAKAGPEAAKRLPDVERTCREAFNRLTRSFAELICRRKGKMVVWEPDFTAQLMEHPWKHAEILQFYESHA
jgi:hypothetical protein